MFEVGTALVERAKEDYGLVVCVVDVAEYEVDVDATERETNGSVSSTVWAVPVSAVSGPARVIFSAFSRTHGALCGS